MSNKVIFIYRATNIINEKSYIGQTVNLSRRMWEHCHGKGRVSLITSAIKKYGVHNIKFEIIDYAIFADIANEMEVFYIKKLKTRSPFGYNLTDGAEGGRGRIPWNKGKRNCYNDEQLAKMRAPRGTYRARVRPTRRSIKSEAGTKKINSIFGKKNPMYGVRKFGKENSFYGKTHTLEAREKIGASLKLYHENKRAICLNNIEGQGEHIPPQVLEN